MDLSQFSPRLTISLTNWIKAFWNGFWRILKDLEVWHHVCWTLLAVCSALEHVQVYAIHSFNNLIFQNCCCSISCLECITQVLWQKGCNCNQFKKPIWISPTRKVDYLILISIVTLYVAFQQILHLNISNYVLGYITVSKRPVVEADIHSTNGVIHVIDGFLFDVTFKNILETLEAQGDTFKIFLEALQNSGLIDAHLTGAFHTLNLNHYISAGLIA